MNKLSSEFTFERFGLRVRLVNELDTDFILSLRTNKSLSRFLHQTENDREKQIEWLQIYKQREEEGRDYYFIYFYKDKPVGVNRIYNIFDYYGTIGSWICAPDNYPEISMATYILMFDILFEFLQLNLTVFDVRKENKPVWKLHKRLGALNIGESDIDYYFSIDKNTYYNHRNQFITLLNLSENEVK